MTKALINKKHQKEKKVVTIGPCSPMQELAFQRATEVDFMLVGGSRGGGKSEVITQIPIVHRWTDDPAFNGMYTRTQYDQLLGAGGLFETAGKYYPLLKAIPTKSPVPIYTFPSKAKIRFKQIANTADSEKMRGLQLSFLGVDEINQVPKEAILFLLTCLRSEAMMNSICIGTMNPCKDSWVFELVKWYLDDLGFVDKEKNGRIRYYIVKDNDFIFADDEDWFKENMPEAVYIDNPSTGQVMYIPPKKFCFVQLTIFDNPVLLRLNPRYLSELQNLPPHERDSQLYGNWFAEAHTVKIFDRKWVRGVAGEKVKQVIPQGSRLVRAWDKAGTEYSPKVKNNPDFTACIGMAKCPNGFYYIYGNFAPTTYDEYEKVYGKFRQSSGARDLLMLNQAKFDGCDTPIVIAQDAGADGKQVFQEMSKKFLSEGFKVYSSAMAVNKSKAVKFEPFLSAAQNGLVFIIEDSFPDQRTLDVFYRELETFQPDINGKWVSSSSIKDDWVDVVSDSFNFLNKQKYYDSPNISALATQPSLTMKALADIYND